MADNLLIELELNERTGMRVQAWKHQADIPNCVSIVKRDGKLEHELYPSEARELAAMLTEAADVADGLPARPATIEDVPLQYVARADFKAPDSDPAIHGRLVAEDTSDVE